MRFEKARSAAALAALITVTAYAQPEGRPLEGEGTVGVTPVKTAQEQNLDRSTELDTIEVTGSRIQREEFASSSPIASFERGDVDLAGTISVDEFLKEIPSFTGFQQTTATNNGNDGQKKVDLRGLGFNRVLVLINGRRQIGDVNGDGAVDLNTIPEALIERVEVLKDGASTVYGSDALAGVVNIILKKNFDGVEFRANYGAGTDDRQAANDGWSVVGGTSSDRGNVVMSLGYSRQREMYQAERPWATSSLYPLLGPDGFQATASGSSNSRKIQVDADGDGTTDGLYIVDAQSGQAREFGPGDIYNFAPVNALITPNERWQLAALGELELDDDVTSYFEALYTRRTSHQRLAPDASFAVTDAFPTPNNGLQWNDFVPANNPYNPFGDNPRNAEGISGQNVRVNRRFVESGGRLFVQGADTFRLLGGLKGELMDTGIFWDLSYTFAQNEIVNETKNYGRFDRWAIAVDPVACAADAACTAAGGVLNPFDDYGSITPDQMRYLTTGSLKDVSFGQLNLISANFNGQLAGDWLQGGAIGWAAGIEQREEEGYFSPDEFLAGGLTTGGASDPQEGDLSATEVYGELLLPVLDDLSIDLSARFSDYDNNVGTKTTFKIGADYQPTSELHLRAGAATGFRAPNITELNQGAATGFPIVDPVCEFGDRRHDAGELSDTAYQNCQTLGVDTSDAGEYGFAWQSAYTTLAPEQNLKPEESTSYHAGVVFTPEYEYVKGLSLGLDYWSIKVDNVISAPDINDLMSACMNSVDFSSPACAAFDNGLPYDGPLPANAQAEFGNLGTLRTSGLDFNAYYENNLELASAPFLRRYHLLWAATYLFSYEREYSLSGTRELAGTANGFAVFPEWRWNAEFGVDGDGWSAAYQLRFIGETTDALRPSAATDDAVAESVFYHDLVGSYTWENLTLTGGINNLTQVDPPRFHSAFNANTEPGTYDVIGRRVFIGAKLSF